MNIKYVKAISVLMSNKNAVFIYFVVQNINSAKTSIMLINISCVTYSVKGHYMDVILCGLMYTCIPQIIMPSQQDDQNDESE